MEFTTWSRPPTGRGLRDFFSYGLDDLWIKPEAMGVDATVVSGPSWAQVAEDIRAERASQENPPALVLIGYSFGGDDVVFLAKRLEQYGIPVKLLFIIDGTMPVPIPPNVDKCVPLYKPTPHGNEYPATFAGNPVFAEPGNDHTEIANQIIWFVTIDPKVFLIEHFNIEESETVHEIAMETFVEMCTTP